MPILKITLLLLLLEGALELIAHLKLYIPHPGEEECDIQANFSIQKTTSNTISGRAPSSKGHYRQSTHIYQCQCGVDHTSGRHASKNRQIPWQNVDCLNWIKLTTVHDEQNSIFQLIWSEFDLS